MLTLASLDNLFLLLTEFEKLPCRVAGVIPESEWNIDEEYNKSERREKSRPIILALASARRALLDSHLNNNQASLNMHRCGKNQTSWHRGGPKI